MSFLIQKFFLLLSFHELQTVLPKTILNRVAIDFINLFSCKLAISSNNPIDSLIEFEFQSKKTSIDIRLEGYLHLAMSKKINPPAVMSKKKKMNFLIALSFQLMYRCKVL